MRSSEQRGNNRVKDASGNDLAVSEAGEVHLTVGCCVAGPIRGKNRRSETSSGPRVSDNATAARWRDDGTNCGD